MTDDGQHHHDTDPSEALANEIRRRREDVEFMERLQRIITEDKPILDTMAQREDSAPSLEGVISKTPAEITAFLGKWLSDLQLVTGGGPTHTVAIPHEDALDLVIIASNLWAARSQVPPSVRKMYERLSAIAEECPHQGHKTRDNDWVCDDNCAPCMAQELL